MKKIATFIFLLLAASNLFALKYISTKYFDIIYPDESKDYAFHLGSVADEVYEKIAADYGIAPQFKMPVLITRDNEVFNAYFTNYNYNHIVMYDTIPEIGMAIFEDSIKETFTHELTHAVSINMKNRFWRGVGSVMGDIINWGDYFTMPTLIKEGASVSQESLGGEGRLNDGYYLHMMRQAKIDGRFPSHNAVAGARDTFPSTSASYGFGGPFTEYIKNKYGMEKYVQFWSTAINMQSFTYRGAFKKVYGVPMSKVWKEFQDSVQVPENIEEYNLAEIRQKNLSRAASLSSFDGGFVFFDNSCGKAYRCCVDERGRVAQKKHVFTKSGVSKISCDSTGRYFAVSYDSENYVGTKCRVSVYDSEKRLWKNVSGTGYRDGTVFLFNGKYYVAAVRIEGQSSSIEIFEFDGKKFCLRNSIELGKFESSFSLEGNSQGLYFILNSKGKRSICLSRNFAESSEFVSYEFDRSVKVRDLNLSSDDESKVLFSYASKETFPRLGSAIFGGDTVSVSLSSRDISGGVYSPVEICGKIFYSAHFFDNYKLMEFVQDESGESDIDSVRLSSSGEDADVIADDENDAASDEAFPSFEEKKFRHLYYKKGTFLPFGISQVYERTDSASAPENSLDVSDVLFLGASWFVNRPSDRAHGIFSAGINPFTMNWGFSAILFGGTRSELFNYRISPTVVFNGDSGFSEFASTSTLSSSLNVGNSSLMKLTFAETNTLLVEPDEKYYMHNLCSATFSSLRKTGDGTYGIAGAYLSANYGYALRSGFDDYQTVYPEIGVYVPKLIPIDCASGWTYNLPFSVKANVVSTSRSLLKGTATLVLLSKEIQDGFDKVSLYFNRVTLESGYSAGVENSGNGDFELFRIADDFRKIDEMEFSDYATVRISVAAASNTGALANPAMIGTLSLTGMYGIRGDDSGTILLGANISLSGL